MGADGRGAPVAQPLQHDILTGTKEDGTKDADTCRDWTVGNADAKGQMQKILAAATAAAQIIEAFLKP